MPNLVLDEISLKYGSEQVLHEISFGISSGQNVAIIGQTGSGKSSLLKIIAGLVQHNNGNILLGDKKLKGPDHQLIPGYKEVAYLAQNFTLPKFVRVEEVINTQYLLTDEEVQQIVTSCDIAHLLDHDTQALSGGEKQRVALARSLSSRPEVLLLDEPYSNLDLLHKNTIKSVVRNIGELFGITTVMVSHDPGDVIGWADTVLALKNGKIVQSGGPRTLYDHPNDEYVAGLFGFYNVLDQKLLHSLTNGSGTKSTKYIYRPEDLVISRDSNEGLKAVINRVMFQGNVDLVFIDFENKSFVTISKVDEFKAGDHVDVTIRFE